MASAVSRKASSTRTPAKRQRVSHERTSGAATLAGIEQGRALRHAENPGRFVVKDRRFQLAGDVLAAIAPFHSEGKESEKMHWEISVPSRFFRSQTFAPRLIVLHMRRVHCDAGVQYLLVSTVPSLCPTVIAVLTVLGCSWGWQGGFSEVTAPVSIASRHSETPVFAAPHRQCRRFNSLAAGSQGSICGQITQSA